MSSRIEQLIDEIEEYINGCKYQKFSSTNIIVNKDEIDELLRELRMKTPEEIKRYQKVVSNAEQIMNDARQKAQALMDGARQEAQALVDKTTVQTNELINEHEIMQQAYAQANEVVTLATKQAKDILDNATIEANSMRMGAAQYTDEILGNVENFITHAIEFNSARYESLISSLNQCNDIVKANRAELRPVEMELQKGSSDTLDGSNGSDSVDLI